MNKIDTIYYFARVESPHNQEEAMSFASLLPEIDPTKFNLLPVSTERKCPSCGCETSSMNTFRLTGTETQVIVHTCARDEEDGGPCEVQYRIDHKAGEKAA